MLTEKQAEKMMGRCVHFNGVLNDCCDAGVSYEPFTGSLPCLKTFDQGRHLCEKRRWRTRAEVEAEHAEHESHTAKFALALPLVSECKAVTYGGGDSSFIKACPVCGGVLRIQIARCNLHARVHCSTDGCVRWIE